MRTFSFVIGAAPAMFIIACASADNGNLVEPPVLFAGQSGSGGAAGQAGSSGTSGSGGKAGAAGQAGKGGKGGSNNGGSDPFGGGGGSPNLPCKGLCGPGTMCVELSPGREECLPEGAAGNGGGSGAGAAGSAGAPNIGGAAGAPVAGSGNGGNGGNTDDPCMGACGENTVCDPAGPWCVLAPIGGAAGQSGAGGNGGSGDPCMGACDPQTTHCEQGPNGPWCVPNLVRFLKKLYRDGFTTPHPVACSDLCSSGDHPRCIAREALMLDTSRPVRLHRGASFLYP